MLNDGVGFFNILAFRGVFFGSPFAQSSQFRWFESIQDWESFRKAELENVLSVYPDEEAYYVKKNCYGSPQKERSVKLLSRYWDERHSWSLKFNETEQVMPTMESCYNFLMSKNDGISKFYNIGPLTALLICGDLVEAGVIPMPSSYDLGQLIYKIGRGAKDGMIVLGLVNGDVTCEDFSNAFSSLDTFIASSLDSEVKKACGYSVVMLEHTLCKIKRLTTAKQSIDNFL